MYKRIAISFGILTCLSIRAELTETIARPTANSTEAVAQKTAETVAAYVNEAVITRLSVQQLVQQETITYEQALNFLIEQQLLLQDFNDKKGKVPQLQLDIQTSNIIQEHFNGNRNAFVKVLQMQGKSLTGLQEELRTSIILNVMRQQKAQSRYSISPKAIRSYYDAHKNEFFVPARYYIAQSGFTLDAKMPQTEVKKSDKLQELLKAGTDLNSIKQQLNDFSSEPTWYSSEELDKMLVDKLETLSPDQETQYLQLNNTFVVTKLLQKTPATLRPLQEVQSLIEEKLLVDHNNKCYQEYVQQLRSKAVVKIND